MIAFLFFCLLVLRLSAAPLAALGNPRFSQSFLHGEPVGSPTPSFCKWRRDIARYCRVFLFLSFFVLRLSAAPLAEFLEFDLAGNQLLILARPIVGAAALRTSDFYELIL